jgi:hypothetical protein
MDASPDLFDNKALQLSTKMLDFFHHGNYNIDQLKEINHMNALIRSNSNSDKNSNWMNEC